MPGPLRRSADEVLDALDDAGDRIRRGLGDRQRDQADAVRDRTDAVRSKDDDLADDGTRVDATDRHASGESDPPTTTTTLRLRIAPSKWDYLFGRVDGGHNGDRSRQNASALARAGVSDTPLGRLLVEQHLIDTINRSDNVARTYTSDHGVFEIRESLFAGRSRFVVFESAWQVLGDVRRFVTMIPKENR